MTRRLRCARCRNSRPVFRRFLTLPRTPSPRAHPPRARRGSRSPRLLPAAVHALTRQPRSSRRSARGVSRSLPAEARAAIFETRPPIPRASRRTSAHASPRSSTPSSRRTATRASILPRADGRERSRPRRAGAALTREYVRVMHFVYEKRGAEVPAPARRSRVIARGAQHRHRRRSGIPRLSRARRRQGPRAGPPRRPRADRRSGSGPGAEDGIPRGLAAGKLSAVGGDRRAARARRVERDILEVVAADINPRVVQHCTTPPPAAGAAAGHRDPRERQPAFSSEYRDYFARLRQAAGCRGGLGPGQRIPDQDPAGRLDGRPRSAPRRSTS